MKILFVDDDVSKYRLIAPAIIERTSVTEADIMFAYDAMQARNALDDQYFDLLILDLLLPLRAGQQEDLKNSIELLRDLTDSNDLVRPGQIIGLTRDKNAKVAAEPLFQDHLWTIVEADPTHSEWIEQIVNCIDYLDQAGSQSRSEDYRTDVAVLTALASPELEAVHQIPWEWNTERPIDRSTMARTGSFYSGGKKYSAICATAPRMGMTAAAILATKVISIAKPKFVVMAGICAGIESRVSLGDVVLADPCWDYQSGKHIDSDGESRFDIAPHQLAVSEMVRARVDAMRRDANVMRQIEDGWPGSKAAGLRLHTGPMASGSAVVADKNIMDFIMRQQRQLLAVEMEAYGILAAAHSASAPQPVAFAMKSVCDFGNSNKEDSAQKYAAYTSAQCVRLFFERYMAEMEDMRGR